MRLAKLKEEIGEAERSIEQLEKEEADLRVGREDTPERATALGKMSELSATVGDLRKQWEDCRENDPDVLKKLEEAAGRAKESANRWTDNIYSVKKYCKEHFGVSDEELCNTLDLPVEIDYVE